MPNQQQGSFNNMPSPPTNGSTSQFGPWGETYPVNPNMTDSPLAVMPPQINIPSQMPNNMQNQMPAMTGQLPSDAPETLTEYIYTPGYLRSNIGNLMRVEFLIGNQSTDRVGVLREVGASYIVLDSLDGNSKMMCDLYSVKFVTILQTSTTRAMLGNFTNL